MASWLMSKSWIVVNPVDGKMRLFTNEDRANRQAFHNIFEVTYYPGTGTMSCNKVF